MSPTINDGKNTGESNDPDVLIIALSVSIVMAFFLIGFLVGVVVYRSQKQAVSSSRAVSPSCSQNGQSQENEPTPDRYQEGTEFNNNTGSHRPLPDRPPEYETIADVPGNGVYGGSYIELDQGAMTGGEYVKLDSPYYAKGIYKQPERINVSPAGNRVSVN
nr:uncharacterized protein LOC129256419 [Lytechinus pictus]